MADRAGKAINLSSLKRKDGGQPYSLSGGEKGRQGIFEGFISRQKKKRGKGERGKKEEL